MTKLYPLAFNYLDKDGGTGIGNIKTNIIKVFGDIYSLIRAGGIVLCILSLALYFVSMMAVFHSEMRDDAKAGIITVLTVVALLAAVPSFIGWIQELASSF